MSMEWLTAGPAGWQELVAALIVGLAAVSLYRHMRGLFGSATSGAGPACFGCAGECEESAPASEGMSTTSQPAGATPVTTTPAGTPR